MRRANEVTQPFDASPRPHLFAESRSGTNRVESIPFGSRPVRVQIVNAKLAVKKAAEG